MNNLKLNSFILTHILERNLSIFLLHLSSPENYIKGLEGAKPRKIDLPILMPIYHVYLRVKVSKVKEGSKL